MQALLAHLDLVARRDFSALRRICGVDDADLSDMIAEIRRLNPKPGLAFGSSVVQPIVPDVFVRPSQEGGWLVELNSDTLPKVLVNQSYYSEVSRTAKNDGEKSYLADCLQTATWLIRALDQRAKTILKVSTEIVRQQDAFFAHGVQFLRPLNLKTVADAIGMHESTVSRVTANKYMATSRGIFELKYFLPLHRLQPRDGGEAIRPRRCAPSDQAVDRRRGAHRTCLSDDTIVDRLREAGNRTSHGEPLQSIAKRCESPRPRCSAAARSSNCAGAAS
jgi:RNA polymerase sigma-54 factor